jgi:hypothetical protein
MHTYTFKRFNCPNLKIGHDRFLGNRQVLYWVLLFQVTFCKPSSRSEEALRDIVGSKMSSTSYVSMIVHTYTYSVFSSWLDAFHYFPIGFFNIIYISSDLGWRLKVQLPSISSMACWLEFGMVTLVSSLDDTPQPQAAQTVRGYWQRCNNHCSSRGLSLLTLGIGILGSIRLADCSSRLRIRAAVLR